MAKQAQKGYDFLLPTVASIIEPWGLTRSHYNKIFNWGFTAQKLIQIFTNGDYFPVEEIDMIYRDLRKYGKDHNFEGWQDIPEVK